MKLIVFHDHTQAKVTIDALKFVACIVPSFQAPTRNWTLIFMGPTVSQVEPEEGARIMALIERAVAESLVVM